MKLHQRVIHPDTPAVPKIMTMELEMDPKVPFPAVQQYYDVKVEDLRNHDFGTKFIDLQISFNNGLEDEPLLMVCCRSCSKYCTMSMHC